MQKIIDDIRRELGSFVGGQNRDITPSNSGSSYNFEDEGLLMRKIPRRNYEDLSKLVPISWL